ncbi:hypothetical protein QQ045_029578 [Rhodiola kirilowii]
MSRKILMTLNPIAMMISCMSILMYKREISESSEDEDGDNLQLVLSHNEPQPNNNHKPLTRYKGFEIRTTPNTLTEAVMSLTKQQKIAVASMGFEGILHLRFTKVHTQFSKWLLESFDSKTCMLKTPRGDVEILPKDVNYMLGLPMGGRPIKVQLRTIPHELLVQIFRLQYGGPLDNSVSWKRISKIIQSSNDANDCFKLNFLVLFYSTVVYSTKSGKSNQRIPNAIEGLDDIRALNWCEFVIDRLHHTKDEWDKDKFQPYTGPTPFLMAMYLDRFQDRFVQVERTIPAIISINDEVIERRIKSEKRQGGFGLHVTLLN